MDKVLDCERIDTISLCAEQVGAVADFLLCEAENDGQTPLASRLSLLADVLLDTAEKLRSI